MYTVVCIRMCIHGPQCTMYGGQRTSAVSLYLLSSERGWLCLFFSSVRIAGPQASGDSPAFTFQSSYRSSRIRNACYHTGFLWVLGIWNQAVKLSWSRLHPLGYFRSHRALFYVDGDASPLKIRILFYRPMGLFSPFFINGDILTFGLIYPTIIYLMDDFNFS